MVSPVLSPRELSKILDKLMSKIRVVATCTQKVTAYTLKAKYLKIWPFRWRNWNNLGQLGQ